MDELYHHGRMGQKWGVQNGPPYPLDRGTVKKIYGRTNKAAKREHYVELSNEELRARTNRINNEKNIRSALAPKKMDEESKTLKRASSAAKYAKDHAKLFTDDVEAFKAKVGVVEAAIKLASTVSKTNRRVQNEKARIESDNRINTALKKMDDEEVRRLAERLQLEKSYREALKTDAPRGAATTRDVLNIIGDMNLTFSAAYKVANEDEKKGGK